MNGRPNLEIRLRCQISPEQCGRSLWFQKDYEQIKGIKKNDFYRKARSTPRQRLFDRTEPKLSIFVD